MTIFAPRIFREMEKEEYLIPVSGMAIGQHDYHFVIDDAFFSLFEYSEVKHGRVELGLGVVREETMMTLNFSFDGEVQVTCDRCADEFNLPIHGENTFIIRTGVEEPDDSNDDEVAYVAADQGTFDVSELIYEYVILSIPMHRVHPEGQCNPKVMELLSNGLHDDETEDEETADPRWAALKNMKLDTDNQKDNN